jgi:hypothetical protein
MFEEVRSSTVKNQSQQKSLIFVASKSEILTAFEN